MKKCYLILFVSFILLSCNSDKDAPLKNDFIKITGEKITPDQIKILGYIKPSILAGREYVKCLGDIKRHAEKTFNLDSLRYYNLKLRFITAFQDTIKANPNADTITFMQFNIIGKDSLYEIPISKFSSQSINRIKSIEKKNMEKIKKK